MAKWINPVLAFVGLCLALATHDWFAASMAFSAFVGWTAHALY